MLSNALNKRTNVVLSVFTVNLPYNLLSFFRTQGRIAGTPDGLMKKSNAPLKS